MGNDSSSALGWDEYFMAVAHAVKMKSKDVSQVGAVLVNKEDLVVSTGFNGIARMLDDDQRLLGTSGGAKLDWMVHAEHNAILNACRTGVQTLECRMYVTKFPCFICLQAMIQAGVLRVYTDDTKYWAHDPLDPEHIGKRYIIQKAGIRIDAPKHPSYYPALPELRQSGPRKAIPSEHPPAQAKNSDEKKAG